MNFVQPFIFFGLPLVALPILIHLLNRLRYRSVKWAAMMFLLSATKSSIRRARLRHYVILALRTLSILFLLLALARPIAGGWLGAIAGGAPETVFLVLDRSASMEAVGNSRKSLREHALAMLEDGAGLIRGNVRFVLAENAKLLVQEVPGTEALGELSLCRATSSSADMPALFGKVLDYAVENRCGDMELWVASDMQASNWRIGSPEWSSLKDRYSALPQSTRIRILSLAQPAAANLMAGLKTARRASRSAGDVVNVSVRLQRGVADDQITVPVSLSLDGVLQQEEVEIDGPSLWLMRNIPLADGQKHAGWGMLELPVDSNMKDNQSFFAYGGEISQLSALVADAVDAGKILGFATAPDPKGMNQVCVRTTPEELDELHWSQMAMLVWQDGSAGSREPLIESFCRQGGTVVLFPSGRKGPGILGVEWSEVESASSGGRFSVVSWESMEGPLARTGDGKDLPVSGLEVMKRQVVGQSNDELVRFRTYASYSDAQPFLLGGRLGKGQVYVMTTLPSKQWSDLARGTVLVPVMQRMLAYGSARLGGARNDEVGSIWAGSDWLCVDAEGKDPCCDAGVYRIGGDLVALNVPESEFDPDIVQEADVRSALDGLEVEFVDSDVTNRKNAASEIWPLFIFLMGLTLLGEAAMLSHDQLIRKEAGRGEKT